MAAKRVHRLPAARGGAVALAVLVFAGAWAQDGSSSPDLSGIWTTYRAEAGARAPDWPEDAPYTEEARAKVAAYKALVEPRGEIPGEFCVGRGMPASMLSSGGYPMEIIQRPEQITIIYELYTEVRRVYLEGPPVDPRDLFATRNGHSTGRWEGDVLVVETTFLKEAVDQASPHSEEATITERYRLGVDDGGKKILTAELRLVDPRFYAAPVTVKKTWSAMEGGRMLLYECTEPAWEEHLEQLQHQAEARETGRNRTLTPPSWRGRPNRSRAPSSAPSRLARVVVRVEAAASVAARLLALQRPPLGVSVERLARLRKTAGRHEVSLLDREVVVLQFLQ